MVMANALRIGFFPGLLLVLLVSAIPATELLFFYERGCPYSAKVDDFLQRRIRPHYPVEVKSYEIHEPSHATLMLDLAVAYGAKDILEKGTPAVFISDRAFQGSSRVVLRSIEEAVRASLRHRADSPLSRLPVEDQGKSVRVRLTLPAVIGAAAASALNPCAGAVLVLLLGTILAASKRKNTVLSAGLSFTAATYVSYFFMGLGLLTTVRGAGLQRYITIAVSIIAVLIGLWSMKNRFLKRRAPAFELPEGWQPLIKRSTTRVSPVLGASFIGLAASLFLLPCTSGPYIVIIGMLAQNSTRMKAAWLLLLYNTIFVLPFVIITLIVGLGFATTKQVEKWRREKLENLRFFTGLFLFSLGMTLIILLVLGAI